MPRFAANLSMLFTEVPFLDRFERAARAGFEAVEFQFPYEFAAADIAARARAAGVQVVLHNLPAGDWTVGDRGLAGLPGREAEFQAGVSRAIEYATTIGVPQLNALAGVAPPGADPAALRGTLVGNLRHAAERLADAGLRLTVEAINGHDIPGFILQRSAQVLEVLDEVGVPGITLQYDIYHMQRSEGELAATLARQLDRIGHIQIADNPGRHEPGSGEIGYAFLFQHLDRIGYAGWVGCEYRPAAGTEAGLGWRQRLGGSAP
jgi:hydroxypyruvate isomerase